MSSIEKIIEGMKLIKEGCFEIPVGDYNCGKSTCPFGWLCYGNKLTPQWIGTFLRREISCSCVKNK